MNQNHVTESSSSVLLPMLGLNVVIEDESEDYVLVGGDVDVDLTLDNDEWDEGSYDHCDLSPSLSCATSVATNVTLKDLNLAAGAGDSNVVMMVDDHDDDLDDPMDVDVLMETSGNGVSSSSSASSAAAFPTSKWNSTLGTGASATVISNAENYYFASNPKSGRRLSNKKLRRKMKMMKKAAAAKALAEQKSAAAAAATAAAAAAATVSGMSSLSSSEATTTLLLFGLESAGAAGTSSTKIDDQGEVEVQKKPRAVSIDYI
jgi:hypothetical protein